MNDLTSRYLIYCINVHCEASIFYNNNKFSISFHTDSLLSHHSCPTCQNKLLSAMDIELEQIAAETKIKLEDQKSHFERLKLLN
jgi:hypothetical protein